MKNNLIIPKSDIKKLEKARLDLHEYLDGLDMGILPLHITSIIWQITHRRYEESE